MKRTEFVKMVTLGAGYLSVAGCIAACTNKASKTGEPVKASTEPKAKSAVGFNIDLNDPKYADLDKPGAYIYINKLIIARTNDGDLVAYDKRCTHQGGRLAYNARSGLFQCPLHGAQFSGNGSVHRGPAQKNLKAHNVVKNDSTLTITPRT